MGKVTSKQMYRLSKNLTIVGDFRLWLAEVQRKIGLNKLAENSANIAGNCFWHSKRCKKVADELYAEGR
jgi:hypothetical protein